MLLGTVFFIVDRAQEGGQPYVALRLPKHVNGSPTLDDAGNLVEISFAELASDRKTTQYRWFTANTWRITRDAQGEDLIEQGDHNLGLVPVVPLHSMEPLSPDDWRATAWAWDAAALNDDLYQRYSEMRELERSQTFSLLVLPMSDDAERERLAKLTISTENALLYDPSGGGVPSYVAPPSHPLELYHTGIKETVQRIYEVANLEFIGTTAASGVALSFYFDQAASALATMAELCEQAERAIAQLVEGWGGREWTGDVTYPREFDVVDLQSRLATAMDAVSLDISPRFNAEVKKRVARDVLGRQTKQETLEAIDNEIDAQGDEYGDRIAREANET